MSRPDISVRRPAHRRVRAGWLLVATAGSLLATCGGDARTASTAPTPPPASPPRAAPEPPAAPTGLLVSETTQTSITWTWNPVEGASRYHVQASLDEVFDDSDNVVFEGGVSETMATSYTASGIDPGTTMHVRVQAVAGTAEAPVYSAWSAHVAGTSAMTPPPGQPVSEFGEFTDSQGRTILFRLEVRGEWDPTEPRGVLMDFHGNNTGTQRDMVSGSWRPEAVLDLGLAYAVVGSPESSPGKAWPVVGFLPGAGGTRFWLTPDIRLVHELLQSGFDSQFAVDSNRVVFSSGSQGTGFVARFVERYAGIYGGGFHARCGDFWAVRRPSNPPRYARGGPWEPSFPWNPHTTSMVRDRFRVFVQITTGDFLHGDAVAMTRYYAEVLGLDTRSDLDGPGGHCAGGTVPLEEIWEWLSHGSGQSPLSVGTNQDTDGDGLGNATDKDDDNDGAWDSIDALPLDPRGYLDTDGDGIGNFEDRDADGDGVNNAEDPFPLDAREWMDADADGIGDNLDGDDDNDGLPDSTDPDPFRGSATDHLTFRPVVSGVCCGRERASVHPGKPTAFVYPTPMGDQQSYQVLELGNGPDRQVQIMIDRLERNETCRAVLLPELCEDPPSPFAFFEHHVDRIYVDTNRNGNLTDDGPPLLLGRNRGDFDRHPNVHVVVNVTYRSGETLPYGLILWTTEDLAEGTRYRGGSVWMGHIQPPSGAPVLMAAADWNLDGLFNSGGTSASGSSFDPRDFVCVDVNRNGYLDECVDVSIRGNYGPEDSVKTGEEFTLDGRAYRLVVAPTGRSIDVVPAR